MEFKVEFSGWYRTRDGDLAEVVANPSRSGDTGAAGFIHDTDGIEMSWYRDGTYYPNIPEADRFDLVEYLGKERPKQPRKYKTTVFLYADGRATLDGILCESHPLRSSPRVVETRLIEWEVPDNG